MEWPDIVYEDMLDADVVVPSITFPAAPLTWLQGDVFTVINGETVHLGRVGPNDEPEK